jgi:hypothetical protein
MTMKSRRNSALAYAGSLSNFTKQAYAKAMWLHLAYDALVPNEPIFPEDQCSRKDRETITRDLQAIKGSNKPMRR